MKLWVRLTIYSALALQFAHVAFAQDLAAVDVAYEKRVLDNGLTVLVHQDDSSPTAFVVVYYKVGSRDEIRGKTGFAHLFEHLMFNGTENNQEDHSKAIEDVGGWWNGDTSFDRTRYYQGVPNTALDRVFWLESERMGHFLGALTQEVLDTERGIVKNEKRQSDNRAYATVRYRELSGLFPDAHPYSWDTIGSLEDLNAASLEDVQSWFKKYYGPANAIIAVGGDVNAEEVFATVEAHFGSIPGGPPVSRLDDFVPARSLVTSEVVQDRAPNVQIRRLWAAPGRDHRESSALRYAATILGGDDGSRLYKHLVKEAEIASSVQFQTRSHELATIGQLVVTLNNGADVAQANAIIDSTIKEFADNGPSDEELSLTRTAVSSGIVQRLDDVAGKVIRLAEGEFYGGDPAFYKTEFDWLDTTTRDEVRDVTRTWLGDNYHQILVEPFAEPSVTSSDVDRTVLPAVTEFPPAKAPVAADFELSNGIGVRFLERGGVPTLSVFGVFDFGRVAEHGDDSGIFEMTVEMLEKGAGRRDADEIVKVLKDTGSRLSVSPSNDQTVFSLTTLSSKADAALELYSDTLRDPSFDADELELARSQKLDHIASDKQSPASLIVRYQAGLLYGNNHPYGGPEHGEIEVFKNLSTSDLQSFHRKWFRPENLTLFVGGDIRQEQLKKLLERHFGDWKVAGDAIVQKTVGPISARQASRVVLFDTPDAPQSHIVAMQQISPPHGSSHEVFALANKIFGEGFASRINANIRVDKGWSYGVRANASNDKGPRRWSINAQVQTDKTSESIAELLAELDALQNDKPFEDAELQAVRNETIRSLPMSLNTTRATLGYLVEAGKFKLPDDDIEERASRFEQVTVDSMNEVFGDEIDHKSLVWIVAGDLAEIEDGIRALNLGPVEVWDVDGNVLR